MGLYIDGANFRGRNQELHGIMFWGVCIKGGGGLFWWFYGIKVILEIHVKYDHSLKVNS